jgi:hypothetical protein
MANEPTILKKIDELNSKERLAFLKKYGKGNIKPGDEMIIIEGSEDESGRKINVTVRIVGDEGENVTYEKGEEEETVVAKKEGLPDFTYRKLEHEPSAPLELQDEDDDIEMQVRSSVGEGFTKKSKVSSFSEFLKS